MASVEAGKLKKGDFIQHQSAVWKVTKTEFYNPGKGSALMKTRIQNVASGKAVDFTFKSNESIETLEVTGATMQYLYNDGATLFFMDNKSFEQYELSMELAGEESRFMKDGNEYYIYLHDNAPIDINLGASVTLEVIRAEDAVRGNTTGNLQKEVELETGAKIMAPAFIRVGDQVSVNPETGEYRGRVNE